ncbi:MAG: GNAT family N-acetyltransferase [Ferruginibacter sp.]
MHIISAATINDVKALNQLVNSAYRGDSSRKGWTTEADLLDGIRTSEAALLNIIEGKAILLKYEENHQLKACVLLEPKAQKLYLGMLTVDPELQGKGIGKLLLASAEQEAQRLQCTAIFMTVISIRKELIDWYIRHGYRFTGETQPFPMHDPAFGLPKQPLEFWVLEKVISPINR